MNGAGPAHGKEASEGVWGRRAGCVVGGGQRGCCSELSNTVRHSELPEHLCSGQLDGLLGEVWLFVSAALAAPAERTVGSEECVPAGSEGCDANTATRASAQMGAPEAGN